ncbi:Tpr-related protein family member, putative [Theileria annulata]|uniref:Tpr-related protein family member, putative n=1 Tax=Theileria annulata TaxID=5874 RepID=Q4U992_THEAN|nr:Tpr-related protein family member, putative [Theileria annulata]CAI76611.1 Tpr-related protein family member, putative [Theileria annulata]|eukprot:XP_953236.1 Tpr-related protein family member, putative [Theileria annulata]
MADPNPTTNYQQDDGFGVGNTQIAAYMFAGLAMMLNIRLSYSAAPYALLRFKLPENLFSVFVRTTSSALELWCIPSMLMGNIMEQVYNQTQNTIGPHADELKNKATQIQSKAGELKTNAGTQSISELGPTNLTDLESNKHPQGGLQNKAGELQRKADSLYNQSQSLENAASPGSTLSVLNELAGQLKTAAKNDPTDGLHKAANDLAQATQTGKPADGHAYNVMTKFDKVETQYNLLMKAAGDNGLTGHPNVTEVVKAYHSVKNTYYQMLITYRIQKKAEEFYGAATQLKTQAKSAGDSTPETPLGKLQKAANTQMDQLVQNANNLQRIALGTESDSNIVNKYLLVADAYNALAAIPEFTAAEGVTQVTQVKDKFGPLKKSYENVLKLRVQELAKKAQALHDNADTLPSAVNELREQANDLRDAASKSDNSSGLAQKAEGLVGAIKTTGDTNGTKAGEVITQFNEVVQQRYETLANKTEYKQKLAAADENVQNVETAYNNLKTLYEKILNFTKLEKKAGELENAANQLSNNPGKVNEVITNYQKVVDSYNALGDSKPIVQAQFINLQKEYSKAIYKYKFHFLTIPSMITNWLNFLTFVILLIVFVTGGENGHVTGYYWIMAASGFVFGINMVLVYAIDYRYLPFYMAGENSFPMVTSLILYFATSIFGNRRKYNSDYVVVVIDVSIAILIAFVASVLWTVAFHDYRATMSSDLTPKWPELISPVAMVIVGMGLVYSIYPGIAPGMIVPFYLIDKIEMVLLVATAFPPVIIAILRKYAPDWSPQTNFVPSLGGFGGWTKYTGPPWEGSATVYAWIWHFFDILIPLQISLAVIFIYSLHYRDSSISRSIVNQPKMSTFLTIVFYMCHEILLALGFPGMVGNNGAGGAVLLPVQYVGALLMVFLAFYSIGYITEYKKHDPSEWPTEGMTKWNAMCYWLKMASKITNKNFKQLFTTDLHRNQVLCIKRKYNVVVCIMNICGIY